MEPIISPVWIYLIHVLNTIYGLSLFALIGSGFVMIMSPLIADCIVDCGHHEESERVMYKIIKICAIVAAICIILLIFIPNEKTIYAMIAASIITPDNISGTEEHIVDLISKIAKAGRETK